MLLQLFNKIYYSHGFGLGRAKAGRFSSLKHHTKHLVQPLCIKTPFHRIASYPTLENTVYWSATNIGHVRLQAFQYGFSNISVFIMYYVFI